MIKYDTLYHIDENDNVRVWWMEQEDNKYRAVSGIENGKLVYSTWKDIFGKNEGKKNATTDVEQCTAEIKALYKKKLDRKYHTTKETIGSGSKIVEPMLADKYKSWDKLGAEYVFSQPKLDGMRCIVTKDGMFSRGGKPIISCPHIFEALKPVFNDRDDLIFDGELYNHDLRDNFNELMSLAKQTKPTVEDLEKSAASIQYHVYDIASPRYSEFGFGIRSAAVDHWIDVSNNPSLVVVQTDTCIASESLDERYAEYLEQGYEGQMVRLDKPYENKRTKSLLKRKEFQDEEFPVLDILEGVGNWSGYAKSVVCKTEDGVIFNAGIKGNQDFTKELLTRNPRPKTVTVRYQNKTPDGSLRFPIAVAFYENERDV